MPVLFSFWSCGRTLQLGQWICMRPDISFVEKKQNKEKQSYLSDRERSIARGQKRVRISLWRGKHQSYISHVSTLKTQMNYVHFCFWTDFDVRAVLKFFLQISKVGYFFFLYKHKIRDSVYFSALTKNEKKIIFFLQNVLFCVKISYANAWSYLSYYLGNMTLMSS